MPFYSSKQCQRYIFNYLKTGVYEPKPSIQTIANAMDVGNPSNFARIYDLYEGSHERIASMISGATYTDEEISNAVKQCYNENGYILDPHGACGYQALKDLLNTNETGIFCETAHPAKFKDTIEKIIRTEIKIPQRLADFMKGKKQTVNMSNDFNRFKTFLLEQQ